MISLSVLNVREFMNILLKTNTFDQWEAKQVEVITFTKFTISCKLNKNFFSSDELELIENNFVYWKQLKPIIIQLIKGNNPPTFLKIILSFPIEQFKDTDTSNIDGLFINIIFQNSKVTITTGTSLKLFTLDKSLDLYWDKYVKALLNNHKLYVEQL